jgi:hypothetical protein
MNKENRNLIKRIAAVNRANLNIPTIKGEANALFGANRMARYRARFQKKKVKVATKLKKDGVRTPRSFKVTELQVEEGGLYNASINTGRKIPMDVLLKRVKDLGFLRGQGIAVTSCEFRSGHMETKVKVIGKNAVTGDENDKVTSAVFLATGPNNMGISFDMWETGRVRFSTKGIDPETVRSFFAHYYPIPGEIKINNEVMGFWISKWVPDLKAIGEALGHGARFEGIEVEGAFEKKRVKKGKGIVNKALPPTFMYLAFKKGLKGGLRRKQWLKNTKNADDPDAFDAKLSTSGYVQIMGTTHHARVKPLLVRFLKMLRDNMFMKERVGPVGPKVENRVQRRVLPTNVNLPAPNVKRTGTDCPSDRCPVPYGFTGRCPNDGWYVKPNFQGKPCCYKIPGAARVRAIRLQVKKAYDDWGLAIPQHVQDVFNITSTYTSKEVPTKAPAPNKIFVKNGHLMIGSRMCMRHDLGQLITIARVMGIQVPHGSQKKDVCALIQGGPVAPRPRRSPSPASASPTPPPPQSPPKKVSPKKKNSPPAKKKAVPLRPTKKVLKKVVTE